MTSNLRERVARLVCAWDGGKICSAMCVTCCNTADAAISLIRNETLEEAAGVADKIVEDNRTTNGKLVVRMAQSASAKSIAAAIRALKEKPNG